MFRDNDHMRKVLVWIYEDILNFHRRAWRIFSQPGMSCIWFLVLRPSSLTSSSVAATLHCIMERLSGELQADLK